MDLNAFLIFFSIFLILISAFIIFSSFLLVISFLIVYSVVKGVLKWVIK